MCIRDSLYTYVPIELAVPALEAKLLWEYFVPVICFKVIWRDAGPVSYTHLDVYKRQVYHKYYDDVLILLKTGLRISELCGLTVADIDFKNEVVIIDHQLLKSKEQGYYIETPKTKNGIRQVPLSRETIQAFQRVIRKRTKGKLIEICLLYTSLQGYFSWHLKPSG